MLGSFYEDIGILNLRMRYYMYVSSQKWHLVRILNFKLKKSTVSNILRILILHKHNIKKIIKKLKEMSIKQSGNIFHVCVKWIYWFL